MNSKVIIRRLNTETPRQLRCRRRKNGQRVYRHAKEWRKWYGKWSVELRGDWQNMHWKNRTCTQIALYRLTTSQYIRMIYLYALFISEKNDDSIADFTRQLSVVENLIDSNTNRHIVGDDSSVDFSWIFCQYYNVEWLVNKWYYLLFYAMIIIALISRSIFTWIVIPYCRVIFAVMNCYTLYTTVNNAYFFTILMWLQITSQLYLS
jgi:hypothetical protein